MKKRFLKVLSAVMAFVLIVGASCAYCFCANALETISGSYDYLCNYIDKNSQSVFDVFNGLWITKSTDVDSAYKTVYAVIMRSPDDDDSIVFFTAYTNVASDLVTGCALRVTKAGNEYAVYVSDEKASGDSYSGEASVKPATYTDTLTFTIKKNDVTEKNTDKSKLFNKLFRDSMTIWEDLLKDKAHISLSNFGFASLGYTPIDISAKFAGPVKINSTLYYYKDGSVDTSFTGIAKFSEDGKWYYFNKGILDTTFEGVALNDWGRWYIKDGTIDFTANGVKAFTNPASCYVFKNGKVNTGATGLYKYNNTWYYFTKGCLDTKYVGMAKNDYGWWYMKNGKLDKTYTGLAKNQYGWWYMKNGKLDKTYKGLAKNQYGWWYVKNGTIDTSYNGKASNQYGTWNVKNGKVVS